MKVTCLLLHKSHTLALKTGALIFLAFCVYLVCTSTQEKGAMTPQETDPDLPISVQESPVGCGLAVACWRVAGTECSSVGMGFEGGHHYLHYRHHSLASGQRTGREHSPAHQQKIGLKVYWTWPRPSEQDSVFPSVSLSNQEASITLLSLPFRGQTEWKPQSQKTNPTDLMNHSLV